MRIESLKKLPVLLQEFYTIVKTLKAKEAKKEESKGEALESLLGYLGEDKSVLIVSQNGLAVCDVNPQAHAEFDRADESPEVRAILDAEKGIKAAHAKLAAALASGKDAGKVRFPKENSIRLEALSPDKSEAMMAKFGPTIRAIRRNKA
jgi:hypothetical protein